MEVVLVMFTADGQRKGFPLARAVTIVGRREDCDLRIPLTEISRKHCRLVQEGDQLRLEDLGSSNGTFHNGARIQEAILQPGDTLQVGPVLFTVQVDGFPPDDLLKPPAEEKAPAAEESRSPAVGPSNGSNQTTTGTFTKRPLAPVENGDFAIAADDGDDEESEDNDVIDLLGSSEDEGKPK